MERAEEVARGRGRGTRRGERGHGRGQGPVEADPSAHATRGTHAYGVRTRGGRSGVRTRGGGRGRERPSAHDLVLCVLEDIPVGSALETPQHPKRKRQRRCGGSGTSTPLGTYEVSRNSASELQGDGSGSLVKRRLVISKSSSSEVRRPLRDEISLIMNYGSEEDTDDDDDNDDEDNDPVPVLIPRAVQPYLVFNDEEDGEEPLPSTISYSWPPVPLSPNALTDPPYLVLHDEDDAEAPLSSTISHSSPHVSLPFPNALTDSPLPSSSFYPSSPSPPRPITSIPSVSVSTSPSRISSPSASSYNIDKFSFNWRAFPRPQILPELRREPFSDINCGPTVPLASPYAAFTAIWDRQIMEHIAAETNAYAQHLALIMLEEGTIRPSSRITNWRDTDADELYVYFAIVLATGIVIKTRLEEYWNSTQDVFITPGFSASMSINRFLLLSRCIHFQDNNDFCPDNLTRAQAKLFKLQPILDHLNNKFSSLYNMGQNIALDESLTMWKGWLDINQFIRNKAATIGIKTYEICESQTGYLWRFEVHAGHDHVELQDAIPDPVSGTIPSIVLRLLVGLENKGHTIWMDNFYNSPALARELKVRGFDCVGTLRTDREFVPVELTNLKKSDMAVGQVSGCTSGDVDLLVWRHKNRVAFVSTYHGLATTMCDDILKPTVVADYNICMGGVDRKDQMLAMFPIERKRNRVWYKKFFRRLLNASVLNAFILYKHKDHHTHTHRSFRKSLINELLLRHSKRTPPTPLKTSASLGHFPAQYEILTKPDSAKREHIRRSCAVCKKRTSAYCMACKVPLCVFTCFEPHHTSDVLSRCFRESNPLELVQTVFES